MSEYSAKTLRDKAKARARDLAKPGNYVKDQMTSSADWTPAEPLETTVKTGARPISPRAYKRGGAVKKATGGEIADAIVKRDTKKVIGNKAHVGGFKCGGMPMRAEGGGVLDKKAVGEVQVLPKRANVEHYKKGGKVKRDMGGKIKETLDKLTGYKSESQRQQENMPNPATRKGVDYGDPAMKGDRDRLDRMSSPYKKGGAAKGGKWIQEAIGKPGALHKQLGVPEGEKIPAKKLAKAAEKGGKLGKRARLAETLKGLRPGRATGGAADLRPLSTAAKSVAGKARGGSARKGKTDINIVINAGKPRQDAAGMMPPMGAAPAMPPVGAPPPAMPPMGGPGMPPGLPGRKAGGRISKVASSYKDMTAGSGSGEGRMQKTDIAKKDKDAPAKKRGGGIRGK